MAATPDQRRKRKRRRRRFALVMLLLLVAGGLIVARSGVLRLLVVQQLESTLDCDVSCRSAVIGWDGRLVATGVRLSVPEVEGEAAQFLEADRLVATLDTGALLSGIRFSKVKVVRPRLRVSQSSDFSVNLANLTWKSGGGGGPGMLPQLDFVDGVIELAEHGDSVPGGYQRLLDLPVEGRLTPRATDPGWLDIQLRAAPGESRSVGPAGGTRQVADVDLTGWVDLEQGSGLLELNQIDLSFFASHPAPSAIAELWRRMDLQGSLESAALLYAPTTGVRARFRLHDVNLNVPLPGSEDGSGEDWVAMSGVTGGLEFGSSGLTARLHGRFEDLECDVMLETQSLDLDAGFRCRVRASELPLESQPQFLAHTPEHVRTLFRRLSGPTAIVSGEVLIERPGARAGEAAEIDVRGELSFRDGAVTYAGFPYPVTQIRGVMSFDSHRLELVRMEGRGPSGAALTMTGHFAPLGPSSGFDLHITGHEVPIDADLLRALPDSSREAVEALMDREALEALRASGDVPANFALGGAVEIATDVHREPHAAAEDTTFDVRLALDSAGVLPHVLPLPMHLLNSTLLVRGGVVTVKEGYFRTTTGGRIDISGSYHLPEEGRAEDVRMSLAGRDIPLDRTLLRATELADSRLEARGMPRVTELVRGLGLQGKLAFTSVATPEGFECTIPLAGLAVDDGPRGPLSDLAGTLQVSNDGVSLEDLTATVYGAALSLDLSASTGEVRGWEARGRLSDVDLSQRIEGVLALLGGGFAPYERSAGAWRTKLNPTGSADVRFVVRGSGTGASDVTVSVESLRNAGFDTSLGRLHCEDLQGDLHYDGSTVRLDGINGYVGLGDERAGLMRASGEFSAEGPGPSEMLIGLEGFRLESQLVREVLRTRAPGLDSWLSGLAPTGVFDGELVRQVDEEGTESILPALRPRSLSFEVDGQTVALQDMRGTVRRAEDMIELDGVWGRAEHWELGCEGRLGLAGDSVGLAELTVNATGTRFDEQIRALLPRRARDVLTALQLGIEGSFEMEGARVGLREGAEGERLGFDATVSFTGGRIGASLPVDEMNGVLTVRRHPGEDGGETTEVYVTAETLRVGGENGIPLTDGRLRLQSTPWGWVSPLAQARLGEG
ncbi:MAG: hypothetical protein KDA21_07105, partial [Phycisphaerales bacterium]|nr:hypothetical protein [Phycisphaerales bacterium]